MARPRLHTASLGQLFDAAPQPLYVLDDELTIVFVNRVLCEWLGPAAEGLIGRQCVYHSPPESGGPDAVAAALCPPPTIARGRPIAGCISRCGADGVAVYRVVNFTPLAASSGNLIGIVALVGGDDLAGPLPVSLTEPEGESLDLHERLRVIRRQTVLRHGIERLAGASPAMCRARAQAELAAGSRASVLLVGPTGSGRQRLAAAIHNSATREPPGTLVPLACALLGAELIHSRLTALAVGKPLADQPGQNTLLLNDADSLPDEIQAEVFRTLSSRTFAMRLMATAEQPLGELARHGRYRADLAALLSTITIELPPLAERRDDIPLLAQSLLEELNRPGGEQAAGFSPEALDRLDAYAWPGNLDELAQAVAHAHRTAAGPKISPDDLPERLRAAAEAAARPRRKEESIVLDEFLEQIERELIRRAMDRTRGNKAKAARLLGLTRPRLLRRVTQLGLNEQ